MLNKLLNSFFLKHKPYPVKDEMSGETPYFYFFRPYEYDYVLVGLRNNKRVYCVPIEKFEIDKPECISHSLLFLEHNSSSKITSVDDLFNTVMNERPSLGVMF